jgi:WD40 repeat protein
MLSLARLSIFVLLLLVSSAVGVAQDPPPTINSLPAGARFRFGSLQFRHPGGIRNSALSPDGKVLATASGRSVMIWDMQTGQCLRRFATPDGHSYSSPGLSFSADGALLGCVHSSEFTCVWNLKSGNEVRLWNDTSRTLGQFTSDGKEFITSNGKQIRYWDVATGKQTRSIPTQRAALLSPDASMFIEVDEKAATIIGEVQTGKEIITLKAGAALNGIENGLAFTPDGKWLALVHMDKSIELRDTATWKLHAQVPLPAKAIRNAKERLPEYRVGLTRDAKLIFLGLGDGTLHRWDAATRKELTPIKTHDGRVANVHELPDGAALVTTGADGLIRRWNLTTGTASAEPESYLGETHSALSADGRFVAIGDARGRIDLWSVKTGKLVRTLHEKGTTVRHLALDPSGATLAVADADGAITLRSMTTPTTSKTLRQAAKDQDDYVTAMRYSPDGRFLYLADAEYRLLRYEIATGAAATRGQSGALALSADGKLLAGAYRGKLTLWDEPTGKIRTTIKFESDRLGHPVPLAMSPDGRLVAAGLLDGHIVLFDARSGTELKRFLAVATPPSRFDFGRESGHHVRVVRFSHDGRWLISGGSDDRLRLWETATAKRLAGFQGHEGEVRDLAFSPDNRTVFSSGRDGESFLWDLRPGDYAVKDAEELWKMLASADAEQAYRTVWALSEIPAAAAELLQSKIVPVKARDPERVRKLIADLNSTNFKTRELAERELGQFDDRARAALEEALKNAGELELRRRLEKLLAALEREPTPNDLREMRAIQALELAAAPETTAVLRRLASGAAGSRLTEDARTALGRLQGKSKR